MSGADAETQDGPGRAAHDAPTDVGAARSGRDALSRLLGGASGGAGPVAGDRLGDAVLLDVLGRGGMGVVWRARDTSLGRDVAVKVLRQVRDPADLARFRAEGEAAARLRHPHVLRVHSAGEHQGWPYLVLDLVEGESLAARLARGPFAPRAAVEVARAIAGALAHAHERGLVHRDVKPANVLLDEAGAARLGDFGLARDLLHDARLTPTGAIVGTAAYMAPEQLRGAAVDARADVWALGVTLHELLAGVSPFAGIDGPPLLLAMERGPPPTGAGAGLDALVGGCLAMDPRERYPTAAALEADLARWLAGGAPRPPRRRRARSWPAVVVVGALLLAGLAVAAALARGASPPDRPGVAPPGPTPAGPSARAPGSPATDERGSDRAPLGPREACEALVEELRGGAAADLDAIAAGLAAARRDRPAPGGLAERAAALAAEVLEARVVKAAADAAAQDPKPALAAAARAAHALELEGLDERLARARLEGLRRAPWGELLAAAVGRHDPHRVTALLTDLARAARLAPPLLAPARLDLARAVRAACEAALGPGGSARRGPDARGDPRHAALVALEDGLFYAVAPEAPCAEGLGWLPDEDQVDLFLGGRDRRPLEAAEALQLVRGQRDDSWRHLRAIASAAEPDRAALERRATAGSAAARLLLLAPGFTRAETRQQLAQYLAPLRACVAAPVQDLPPGVAALALVRLARAHVAAEGAAARPEVDALVARALARLAELPTEGLVTVRLSEVWAPVLAARAGDGPALEAAAREGLAVLDRQAPFADTAQETRALLAARADLLGQAAGHLDGALPDGPAVEGWFARAEAAALAAGDFVHQSLVRRLGRVQRRLDRGQPGEALREAEDCWTTLAPALRRLGETEDEAEKLRLAELARRFTKVAAQAAEATGDASAAAAWRARTPG